MKELLRSIFKNSQRTRGSFAMKFKTILVLPIFDVDAILILSVYNMRASEACEADVQSVRGMNKTSKACEALTTPNINC